MGRLVDIKLEKMGVKCGLLRELSLHEAAGDRGRGAARPLSFARRRGSAILK